MTQNIKINFQEFLEKIKKETNELDLSADEDLSIALMNLISIEEHFYFSGAKTGNKKYFDFLNEIRQIRKELLKKLVKNVEEGAEIWCLSKHLLAATMRLFEVGTKEMDKGDKESAYSLFEKAYSLYSLFWGINFKIIDVDQVKKIEEDKINKEDKERNVFKDLKNIVKKLIDCCKE